MFTSKRTLSFQVSFPAFHLARYSRKSVPGVSSPPSTWHGFSAKAFQVSLSAVHLPRNPCESVPGVSSCRPPGTVFPQKCTRCLFSAVHLARFLCKSVPGVSFCCPPGTESPQKRARCLSPPSTWHGIPAKVFQVSHRAVHLPRFPSESVPGVTSCRPPGTEFLRKCSR